MNKYAEIYWNANDIIAIRPDATKESAEEWLGRHEETIKDILTERGWGVIEALLCQDGITDT